jgi:hypothetical protein
MKEELHWAWWWHMPVITALRRLRQEDHEFEAIVNYIEKPCLNKKKKERKLTSVYGDKM